MYNHSKNIVIILAISMTLISLIGCGNKKMKTIKEQNTETTINVETSIENTELEDNNEFYKVLDNIASTHPGTAGCSIQILFDAKDLLNICKSKLPLDIIARHWLETKDKNNYSDINESFSFLLDNLNMLKDGDDKKIFDENDVENTAPYDDALYDIAKNVVETVINLTK